MSIFIIPISILKVMKTFSTKGIPVTCSFMATIDIGLLAQDLTYMLLKSTCEIIESLFMPEQKITASMLLLISGRDCHPPTVKNSSFFQYLYI